MNEYERENIQEVHIEIEKNDDEVTARVVQLPCVITVDLKHPIQYGAYKQSYYRGEIASMEMVSSPDGNDGVLQIWASDRYVYIPYSNIVMWTFDFNHDDDNINDND